MKKPMAARPRVVAAMPLRASKLTKRCVRESREGEGRNTKEKERSQVVTAVGEKEWDEGRGRERRELRRTTTILPKAMIVKVRKPRWTVDNSQRRGGGQA